MSEQNQLDLSQVSVSNLLNDDAPSNIPSPEPEVQESKLTSIADEPDVDETPADLLAEDDETPAVDASTQVSDDGAEEEEEVSVIDVLRSKLGYEIEGEFSEDYDGVVSFTQTVANEIAREQLDSVFSQFPDVEQYLNYRYNGGDPKQYFQAAAPQLDFSAIEIDENDVNTQRTVVQEFLLRTGYTGEEANEAIQDYIDAGILERQAKRSLGKLKNIQAQEQQQLIRRQQQQAQQHRQQIEQQWNAIQQTIDSGTVRGFEIPTADRKKFYSWMSDAVDNQGRTQRIIDREKLDMETQVAMEYLLWKNFDLNKLVTSVKNTQQAQNLKQKLQQNTNASKRMKGGGNSSRAPQKLPSLKDLL